MERYLTHTAQRRSWWEVPSAGMSAFVGAVAVQVFVEDLIKGFGDPVIELLAHFAVLALVFSPLYAVGRRMVRRRRARKIAAALAKCGAELG